MRAATLPIALALSASLGACATEPPPRVIIHTPPPTAPRTQPLGMKVFVHIGDDGTLLMVGGPGGRSHSMTSRQLFAEIDRLAGRGLVLLYSLDSPPEAASAAARSTLTRLETMKLTSKRVDTPVCGASPYGEGATILMAKSQAGDLPWIEDLLERGVSLDDSDDAGKNALTYAAGVGRAAVVARLLRAGARVDQGDQDGSTALMYAAQGGHTEVVQALLAGGARPGHRGAHGLTALDFAQRSGHTATAAALRAAAMR